MNCNECSEKLSDFLLDELPEHEAVLVHEHLALCPSCMETYKELKGTGKALEAVPALQPLRGNQVFGENVRVAAQQEAVKIIEALPPEKRLRVEARAAARRARVKVIKPKAPSQRRPGPWPGAGPLLILLGVAVAAAILLYPRPGAGRGREEVGTLAIGVGQAEQFWQKEGQHWSQVQPGKPVMTGDEFATRADGRLRIELTATGSVLLGPSSELKLRHAESDGAALLLDLVGGEMGIERPVLAPGEDPAAHPALHVRTGAADLVVPPGAQVYLKAGRNEMGKLYTEASVRKGAVQVAYWKGKKSEELADGHGASYWEDTRSEPTRTGEDDTLPLWRAELLNDKELAKLLGGRPRALSRRSGAVVVELTYGFDRPGGLQDWQGEGGKVIAQRANGSMVLSPDVRFALLPPLAAPLTIEAAVHPDTPKETAFAFAVLEGPKGSVSVDVDKGTAVLQVKEKDRPAVARVDFKAASKTVERVRLDLAESGHEVLAAVTTSAGKTKEIAVPKDLLTRAPVWMGAYRGDLVLEGLRVTGVIPAEWLRARFAKIP